MTRHFRIASPDEAAPVSITAAPDTESVVDRALTMLGAALRPDAVDTYPPTRILDTLRMLHESGMAQAHRARVTATTARMEIAAAFAQPSPAEIPPPDEAAIAETLRSVQRHTLNMSVPPPNRHVAYLTHQLRRAFAEAYQHGWNAGRRHHADLVHALDTERRAAPEPTTDRQRSAIAQARAIITAHEAAP